jgi:hypothetical protein
MPPHNCMLAPCLASLVAPMAEPAVHTGYTPVGARGSAVGPHWRRTREGGSAREARSLRRARGGRPRELEEPSRPVLPLMFSRRVAAHLLPIDGLGGERARPKPPDKPMACGFMWWARQGLNL